MRGSQKFTVGMLAQGVVHIQKPMRKKLPHRLSQKHGNALLIDPHALRRGHIQPENRALALYLRIKVHHPMIIQRPDNWQASALAVDVYKRQKLSFAYRRWLYLWFFRAGACRIRA